MGSVPSAWPPTALTAQLRCWGWLVNEHAIEPHIPVFDRSARDDGTFSRDDFAYEQEHNGATLLYRANQYDRDACELKPRCCPKVPARKVPRSIHEQARDVARDIAKTDAYVRWRRERKKIEMLFAHLKRILRLDRLRLRGQFGAQDEITLWKWIESWQFQQRLGADPYPNGSCAL